MSEREERTLDRRELLKLGTVAGLALTGPLAHADKLFGAGRRRIGVIVPTGSSYRRHASSLVAGLRLGAGNGPAFVVREATLGYGGAHTAASELLDARVEVLVAAVSAPVARLLAPLAESHRRTLIVANAGAHAVTEEARSPYVLHNSLQLWQASYAAGRWAGRNIGRRAFLVSSRADAGYDTLEAFRLGLESSGGSVVGSSVTHDGTSRVEDALAAASAADPDFVYGCYSGRPACDFVHGFAGSSLHGRVPLLAAGFAVEDYALRSIGRAASRVGSAASWSASRRTDANRAFLHAYRAATGRRADPFAVLGYETGLLIGLLRGRAAEALGGESLVAPRGRLKIDARSNAVSAPIAIRRVSRGVNVEIARVGRVTGVPATLTSSHSAYLNEYLCT